jgi:hypothetical protein
MVTIRTNERSSSPWAVLVGSNPSRRDHRGQVGVERVLGLQADEAGHGLGSVERGPFQQKLAVQGGPVQGAPAERLGAHREVLGPTWLLAAGA